MNEISWADFEKLELRAGTILEVMDFPPKQIGPFVSECIVTGL